MCSVIPVYGKETCRHGILSLLFIRSDFSCSKKNLFVGVWWSILADCNKQYKGEAWQGHIGRIYISEIILSGELYFVHKLINLQTVRFYLPPKCIHISSVYCCVSLRELSMHMYDHYVTGGQWWFCSVFSACTKTLIVDCMFLFKDLVEPRPTEGHGLIYY